MGAKVLPHLSNWDHAAGVLAVFIDREVMRHDVDIHLSSLRAA